MKPPAVGDPAPPFDLPAAGGDDVTLSDLEGQPVVLLFYPGDFTPICTKQMCEVRDTFRELSRLEAVVLGISTDSVEKHARFREKHRLPFRLLADEGGWVAKRYGVKGFFGRAKRATFVIDRAGIIRYTKVTMALFRPNIAEVAAVLSDLRREDDGDDAGELA